jgi:hypothetical protein
MKIEFLTEGGTTFAVALNQKFKRRFYEELLFAEVAPMGDGVVVRWNDDFFNPQPFSNIEEAKQTIINEHSSHTPESNGKEWV